jgi:hypothetical protein
MSSPTLTFPPSPSTVKIRMLNTTACMTVRAESFVRPVQPGHEFLNLTCVAFLIEHAASGKKVMFDLGVRKDYWNYAAVLRKRIGTVIPALRVDCDVPEILEVGGTRLDEIGKAWVRLRMLRDPCAYFAFPCLGSVIWSHYHWDHIGDMSLFPAVTEVVVGPGFKASPLLLPGFPEKADSPVLASDFQGRSLREIDFASAPLEIGGYAAFDFFGDASFYLLGTCFSLAGCGVPQCRAYDILCHRYAGPLYRTHVRPGAHDWRRREHIPAVRRRHLPFRRRHQTERGAVPARHNPRRRSRPRPFVLSEAMSL